MRRTRIAIPVAVAVVTIAVATSTVAAATEYPAPGRAGSATARPDGARTFRVCTARQLRDTRRGRPRACSPTIQAAVDRTRSGDTVRVPPGTYRESVEIRGHRHDRIRLIGSPRSPRRTVLELRSLSAADRRNAVVVDGADGVTLAGFYARHYLGNGFFALRVARYRFDRLVAGWGGAYGIYAFHSKGGTITNSEAFYNNDSGFYIGETPPQSRPIRSIVANVRAWGNAIGFSGTNMRYVTIRRSRWYNNGLGIVPNALDFERFPPPEHNLIADNDVFWNNFDYFRGAPFSQRRDEAVNYPIGTGILLYGSRDTTVEGNRVFGQFLMGVGLGDAIELGTDDRAAVRDDTVRGNAFGRNGTDLNKVDLFYPGTIRVENRGNCFADNTGVHATVPTDGSTLAPCPYAGVNPPNSAAVQTGIGWFRDPTREAFWTRHEHPPFGGIAPLVRYTPHH